MGTRTHAFTTALLSTPFSNAVGKKVATLLLLGKRISLFCIDAEIALGIEREEERGSRESFLFFLALASPPDPSWLFLSNGLRRLHTSGERSAGKVGKSSKRMTCFPKIS